MPNPLPDIDDLLLQYPKAPFPPIDTKGNPTTLYMAWTQGYAALCMARSLQALEKKTPNADGTA